MRSCGHLLGLGDTYQTSGINEWKGEQPPSVMNGESYSLTDDDRLGLWATLRQVKTGVRGCEGTAEAQYTVNGFGSILCNAKSTPVSTHGTFPEQGVSEPPSGPIPESTLRETADYTVAALQLNCRAGAGTENPVITKLNQGTPLRGLGRIAYSTDGVARRGPVTVRKADLRRIAKALEKAPRLREVIETEL